MIFLEKGQMPLLATALVLISGFSFVFFQRQNYEFIIYIGVMVFFLILIVLTNKKVRYTNGLLWALLVWAALHMSGGGLYLNGSKIYDLMLISLVGEPYNILKFDQAVHLYGFFVATLLVWHLMRPMLKKMGWVRISIILASAGLGLGALNEIVEFAATVIVPETGVGGYLNTSLDLVADLIGSILATIFIYYKNKNAK